MRRSTPQSMDTVIKQLIKEMGLEKGLLEAKVYATFKELTGTRVAKAVSRKYISGRMLVVELNSSIARSELMMIRNELAAAINQKLGSSVIDGIILK